MNRENTCLNHFPTLFHIALDLFRRPSPSGREELMRAYVVDHLERHGFTVSLDAPGNVLAVRGRPEAREGYPLFSFHLDCVSYDVAEYTPLHGASSRQSAKKRRAGQLSLRPLETLALDGSWLHSRGKFVLGGDDKCGGAIALTLAAMTDLPLLIPIKKFPVTRVRMVFFLVE